MAEPDVDINVDAEALKVATVLTETVKTLSDQIGVLAQKTSTNRRLIKLLALSVVFDILLSIGLGFIGFKAYTAGTEAKAATVVAHVSAVASCQAGNEFRRDDRSRWQRIIDITPVAQRQTPQVQAFIAVINRTDALRDCHKA